MTAGRQARILSAIQTMAAVAGMNVQRLGAEIAKLSKKREEMTFHLSGDYAFTQAYVAQMENNISRISHEIKLLSDQRNNFMRESLELRERERIAADRLRLAEIKEYRVAEERECLDWVLQRTASGGKPQAGLEADYRDGAVTIGCFGDGLGYDGQSKLADK